MKKKILSVLLILALVVSSLSQVTQALAEGTTTGESQIDGVALTQNAIKTSDGTTPTYQEAGIMVSWWQNQITDISTMEWIAVEYYNPTGAAWPFVFKLQCGGQQVYTNNNAVQYTLLDSNFQVVGTQSTSAYVSPGVSTSGWLVFPRAIFNGIDNLSGALEAMYLLLPCTQANQNNVTELHFGRIMSYTTKTVSDYSQGTVVADLSTWSEDIYQYTYAATAVGDDDAPLVSIRKVSKPVSEPEPEPGIATSEINGVSLMQTAIKTSDGTTPTYQEAGLMINWWENQISDISTMEWIAIEYYNPTGAAWPFVFKLQCGGQQVYTNNNAVQYTLLDSTFQVVGTQSTSAYVSPGVSTSGWLVFPRAIFNGIDNLSGALEAMYLLLPCTQANQNNVTELHFGRIMSYTQKEVSDYSQGTVVADLSTWEESYLNSTYAASSVGDGNVPLVTIEKVTKPIVSVSGITLDKDTVRMAVGATDTLVASLTPSNADNKTVMWESSVESVATVSQSGVVSAVSVGTTVVTATTEDGGFVASCNVTVIGGSMLFDDSYMEKEFNYCPSIMQVDDDTRYIYYCANKDSEQVYDHIYCRRGTKGADGKWTYGAKTLVLSPTSDAYDSMHCCDPSVIKGEFNYNGTKYSYLMAYTGNSDQINNKVGLAVSNDPISGWVKIPNAFREYTGSASDWGYGQPSLISIDKKSEVLLFYSVGTSTESYTQVETWELSDLNDPKLKTSIKMTQNGLTDMNGNTGDYLTNGDFAYDPAEERYYCVSDAHPFTEESIPTFVSPNLRVTYINAKGTYLGEVFTTPDASAGKRWHTLATAGPDDTGFDRNSNGGIVTDEYGWILSADKLEIGYTGSMAITIDGIWDWLWSYRMYSWTFSVDEQEDVVDSKLNGVVLTQNAIQTVNGQPQYNEAGIFASYHWFANQVQDLSTVQWVAVEYYNPTGAAWPFVFKLQSDGQQVYTQDTNVPYHILTSNFQYVESKTVSAGGYISPGINTSGWLLFPRSVFGGASGVTLDTFGTGSLEAMFILLPCTQENQNNITELHFGRVLTYTDSAVPYTDNGTVVADLSTWNKSMTAGTYAYSNTGDNDQPLVTIRYADAVSEPCDANQDLYFDSRDIVRMKRHMASPSTIYILQKKSDLDYNGSIDNNDLAIMRNHLLADVSYLP